MLGYGKPVGYICRVIGGPGSNKYTTSGTSPRTQRSFYNVSEAPKTIIFLVNRHCISSSVFFYPLETKMATHGSTMVTSVLANLILIPLADSLTNSALGVLIDPPWPLIPGFWNRYWEQLTCLFLVCPWIAQSIHSLQRAINKSRVLLFYSQLLL